MCISGIPDLVNGFHGSIYCRIKTNGKISSGNILVYRSRKADTGNIKFIAEFMSAPERTVTADNHQAVDAQFFQVGVCLLPSFVFKEFLATGSF